MFIHVYKPLTCTGRRTWNLRELGNSRLGMDGVWIGSVAAVLVLRTGVSLGINVSVINASTARFGILAFWVGDAVQTSFPLRWGYDSDSDSDSDYNFNPDSNYDSWFGVRCSGSLRFLR